VFDLVFGQQCQEVGDWAVGVADGVEEHVKGGGRKGEGGASELSSFFKWDELMQSFSRREGAKAGICGCNRGANP
jgi:hypothetical protein